MELTRTQIITRLEMLKCAELNNRLDQERRQHLWDMIAELEAQLRETVDVG